MRLEAFDRFERQEEGGVAAAVARVAAGGFDGGREGVGGPADYSPAFVANADDLAGLEGRGVRGHADASARRVPPGDSGNSRTLRVEVRETCPDRIRRARQFLRSRATVAPRCDSAASQNSSTSG